MSFRIFVFTSISAAFFTFTSESDAADHHLKRSKSVCFDAAVETCGMTGGKIEIREKRFEALPDDVQRELERQQERHPKSSNDRKEESQVLGPIEKPKVEKDKEATCKTKGFHCEERDGMQVVVRDGYMLEVIDGKLTEIPKDDPILQSIYRQLPELEELERVKRSACFSQCREAYEDLTQICLGDDTPAVCVGLTELKRYNCDQSCTK